MFWRVGMPLIQCIPLSGLPSWDQNNGGYCDLSYVLMLDFDVATVRFQQVLNTRLAVCAAEKALQRLKTIMC